MYTSLLRPRSFRKGRAYYSAKVASVVIPGSNELEFRTGQLAKFASANVVASSGDSAIMATCVANRKKQSTGDGVPLMVEYRQSASAVGRIPMNFLRRELSQSDNEILLSRAIDRSLRPLFVPGTPEVQNNSVTSSCPIRANQTIQVVCKPLALDENSDQLMLGINAAACALHVSDIPFNGPLAAVRIAKNRSNELQINPNREFLNEATMNIILSAKKDERTIMIEFEGKQISIETIEEGVEKGMKEVNSILRTMDDLRNQCGKEKFELSPHEVDQELTDILIELTKERIFYVMTDSSHDKVSRDVALRSIIEETMLLPSFRDFDPGDVQNEYFKLVKTVLRETTLNTRIRCDGRKLEEFRPITINVDMYKKLHGCSLFQRGQTQVLSTVTFDSPSAAFHPDSIASLLGAQRKKTFILHYEFPGYATNEIGTSRGANRREIGHGALAEKALRQVLPDDFSYTTRLACQVLESNGSSSMASVCGGSLALLDAGVPLKAQAAGVAIGLMTNPENPDADYRVLTDILGIEDYGGDMDFKIAGTKNGFTAMQLDVKIDGLTREQLRKSMEAGERGLEHVLAKMNVIRDRPREKFKESVPIIENMKIEPFKRVVLFRNNAYNCKLIEAETGVKVTADDDTSVSLMAANSSAMEKAKEFIKRIMNENDSPDFTFGQILSVEVSEIKDKGVYVLLPGSSRPVFVQSKHLTATPVSHTDALGLRIGDKLTVQWFGRDEHTGNVRLSRKTLAGAAIKANLRR